MPEGSRVTILEQIVEEKRREVAKLPALTKLASQLAKELQNRDVKRDFTSALRNRGSKPVALIAEIKKASPSAGVICSDFDPVRIAKQYESAGANCLSILTDQKFFQGSLDYLKQIREAVKLPLLRKDFIIDERQILEAIGFGADAILLIVAILSDAQLKTFHGLAREAGLAVLVEVHDEVELDRALRIGAQLIGVNNRDLKTFKVDLATTERLSARLHSAAPTGPSPILIAESGIHTHADIQRLVRCGAQAVLVGESLMRHGDVQAKVRELLGA